MPLCFISFALLLMAIAAGMFLLAKTNKDGLGNLFRFVSWFIIVGGFLGIMACGMACMMRMCHQGGKMKHRHGMRGKHFRMKEGGKQIIIRKFGDDPECQDPKEKCPGEGPCCQEGHKKVEIKDSVIMQKK